MGRIMPRPYLRHVYPQRVTPGMSIVIAGPIENEAVPVSCEIATSREPHTVIVTAV